VAVATAFTPAGAAVGEWVRDVVRPARDNARSAIGRLPASGRLLVSSPAGAWVVHPDGSARRLGAYREAGWSPHGLYVVATRGRQLVALEPDGKVHWTLSRDRPVRHPVWSPAPGYRIGYLSGSSLRVVAGDGTGDRLTASGVAGARPAWRPGAGHLLAYARPDGGVVLTDVDSGRRLWRTGPGPVPKALAWTPDGSLLVALTPRAVRVFDRAGRPRGQTPIATGLRAEAMAVDPGGRSVAVIRRAVRGRSEVVTVPLSGPGGVRHLFAGQGRFTDLAWSPDGRWLLLAWREADEWIFIRSSRVRHVDAVRDIRRQFDPGGAGAGAFPRLGGWCCGQGG
jgi:hypothetical protein